MTPTLPSLLAVFAHPDDESLAAGGLLARHSASGASTAVVTATWAEGTGRAGELAEAVRILGAGEPRLLGYADARVPESAPGAARFRDAPLDEVVGRLVAHIREFRPEIVVTHDPYGNLSGHPDHVHAHRVTVLAVTAAGWGRLYPEAGEPWETGALWFATHPESAVRALGREMLLRPGREVFAVPDAWVSAVVDVGPWVERKLEAVMAHRSEVARGALPGRLAALPARARARAVATEWYIRQDVMVTGPRSGLTL
ncbi:PIG-L family deacetylase [Streptomyces sp. NPDC005648]|uniref:PIG-L deacetylase family protein n=1 Tax=Streptomyces sp. NPDC005648 TaxID=3157044 RepID=UPI0033B65CA0